MAGQRQDYKRFNRREFIRRSALTSLAVSSGGVLLSACGDDGNGNGNGEEPAAAANGNGNGPASGDPIVIGATWPMTGPAAAWGQEPFFAAQIVIESINENGGIQSMGGRPLEIVTADHENAPRLVVSETERLISREDVVIMAGFSSSGASAVGRDVVERLEMPCVDFAYADDLTDGDPHWFFRSSIRTGLLAESGVAFAQAMEAERGQEIQRVVLLHEDGPFGTEALEHAAAEIEANTNWDIIDTISYSAAELSDAAPLIRRMTGENVDVLFASTQVSDGVMAQQAMNELGFHPMAAIHLAGAPYNQDFIDALGSEADHVYNAVGFSPAMYDGLGEDKQSIMDRFREEWDIPVNNHASQAFNMIFTIVDALERAGTTDNEEVREAIAETDLSWDDSPYLLAPGGVRFNERHDNELAEVFMFQMMDSQLNPVWPEEEALEEAVWPHPEWDGEA